MKTIFKTFTFLLLLTFSSLTQAKETSCPQLLEQAEKEQAYVRPVLGLRVEGSEKLYFHTAPHQACASKAYVIPQDKLIAYNEWKGWYSVQYTHPKTGKISEGWIPLNRVKVTGTMGMNTSPDGELVESSKSHLPQDAAKVIDRFQSCNHFSGEFNGDQSERDKEIAATLKELRCDTIEKEVEAIRKKYSNNKAVLEALQKASEL